MTVWYRFLLQVLSGWRITPPYASFYKRNTFNVDLMQIQQLLCLQKSTLNVFFMLPWVVRRGLFSTFITRGLPVIAQSEIFLLKGVSFYPSISPFTMKGCEGYACKNLMLTNGEEGKSLRIARRRKYFVWDGYKRPRFFSIYYEGICGTSL